MHQSFIEGTQNTCQVSTTDPLSVYPSLRRTQLTFLLLSEGEDGLLVSMATLIPVWLQSCEKQSGEGQGGREEGTRRTTAEETGGWGEGKGGVKNGKGRKRNNYYFQKVWDV